MFKMKCHVCKIYFLFVDISNYPTLFSSGDPLKDLCDQLLLSGVDDMRHTFSKIIGEAALKLEEACAQGATPKGLRIIVDAIGRYVVIEFDAGNDDLEEVIVRLAFEVSIIYLFSFEGGSFNTVFLFQDRAAAINLLDELELDELTVVPSDEFYFSKIRSELHPFYLAHTFSSKCLMFFVDPRGVQYLWYLNQSIGYYVVSKCLSTYIGSGQRW